MKNIMIVDGAINCAYDVFQASDDDFKLLFPAKNQNIQFEDEISDDGKELLERLWKRPIKKSDLRGIHGIIFYELPEKKKFYPTRKDSDLDGTGRAEILHEK